MTSKLHTPGPWKAEEPNIADQVTIWPEGDGHAVAVVYESRNAALIAAAPETAAERDRLRAVKAELLAALRCTLADLEGMDPEEGTPAYLSIQEARAAIAKAEGKDA